MRDSDFGSTVTGTAASVAVTAVHDRREPPRRAMPPRLVLALVVPFAACSVAAMIPLTRRSRSSSATAFELSVGASVSRD